MNQNVHHVWPLAKDWRFFGRLLCLRTFNEPPKHQMAGTADGLCKVKKINLRIDCRVKRRTFNQGTAVRVLFAEGSSFVCCGWWIELLCFRKGWNPSVKAETETWGCRKNVWHNPDSETSGRVSVGPHRCSVQLWCEDDCRSLLHQSPESGGGTFTSRVPKTSMLLGSSCESGGPWSPLITHEGSSALELTMLFITWSLTSEGFHYEMCYNACNDVLSRFKAPLFLQGYYTVGSTDWMCFGVREICSLFWKILDKIVIEFSSKETV